MNILESLFGAKNTISERAGGYSDALVGSLRDRSGEWSGQAEEYSNDAADKANDAAEALDDWRQTPAGRIGMWIGLGVAILGGALYAWKLYQDMQGENSSKSSEGSSTPRKANSSQSSLKEKVGMPVKSSTSSAKKKASEVGSGKSKSQAASHTTSAQTPKADRVKAKSQHTAHVSSEAKKEEPGRPKATAKAAPKPAEMPSGTGAKARGRKAVEPPANAAKPRAAGS
jgi:hypothetical protein